MNATEILRRNEEFEEQRGAELDKMLAAFREQRDEMSKRLLAEVETFFKEHPE